MSFLGSQEPNAIANSFSMGYTFIEYKDNSNELLSTLEVYTLPGTYNEPNHLPILQNLSRAINTTDLLVVNLLDYNARPENWLQETQIWNNILRKELNTLNDSSRAPGGIIIQEDKINQLTIVLNKSSFVEIDPEIHEFIQANIRIQAMLLKTSVMFVPSLSSHTSTSSNIKSIKATIINLVSHLLSLPLRTHKPSEIQSNFTDISNAVIIKGTDDLFNINILYHNSNELYDTYVKSRSLDTNENPVLLNYSNTVKPHFDEIRSTMFSSDYEEGDSKIIKQDATKNNKLQTPIDVKFDDFLEVVYQNRTKLKEGDTTVEELQRLIEGISNRTESNI
ncbi:hypothetical protein WICPIJ_001167 [Wickerhamomyces pijperi]|uniref:Uncharacterized protein n=1 Tax=Wickerhamomyces pijperi TaxID=599730 RepID=A0A9P8TR26_WICPI|nr:hypothetical protein WICPIJ_001167 [Wickerhamomyces pijperi]